jgi:hypothetical protein
MNRLDPYRKRLRFAAAVAIIGTIITFLMAFWTWFVQTAQYSF